MKNFKRVPLPALNHINDYPMGSSCQSFHITDQNSGWRVFMPVIDEEKCVGCYRCYLVCPDGAIHRNDDQKFEIDYDYCKGCGICAYECKLKSIQMVKEEK